MTMVLREVHWLLSMDQSLSMFDRTTTAFSGSHQGTLGHSPTFNSSHTLMGMQDELKIPSQECWPMWQRECTESIAHCQDPALFLKYIMHTFLALELPSFEECHQLVLE
jgi:hypothetical protein